MCLSSVALQLNRDVWLNGAMSGLTSLPYRPFVIFSNRGNCLCTRVCNVITFPTKCPIFNSLHFCGEGGDHWYLPLVSPLKDEVGPPDWLAAVH